ncbi:MAG: MATE family efflux transporter [Alkalispirochaetaceae bacterium]
MGQERELNLTGDRIPSLILRMAVPASTGFFFNTMFNVVDTFYAGRLSTDALAALSLSFPFFMVILSLGIGVGAGTNALISNALGGGRREEATFYQAQALSFALIGTILTAVSLYFLLEPLFRLFDAEGAVLAGALGYMRVIVIGGIVIVLNNTLNAGLQARGNTRTFRNFLFLAFILNIGLDPLFMFGLEVRGVRIIPAMEEAGVALATILVQVIGLFMVGRVLIKSGGLKHCNRSSFRPRRDTFGEIASQALPGALNFLTIALGAFVINYFVSRYGRNAVAAYGAALRIEQIALLPTIGLNVALASMVGQNNGAGRLDRVEESYRTSLRFAFGAMILILTPVIIFAPWLLGIFSENQEVISIGRTYLYIQVLTFFSYILINQSNSVLQGLKRPGMIMWVGVYRQMIAPFIVFPLLIGPGGFGLTGVWWGLVIVNWSAAVFTVCYTRSKLKHAMGGRQRLLESG